MSGQEYLFFPNMSGQERGIFVGGGGGNLPKEQNTGFAQQRRQWGTGRTKLLDGTKSTIP
jgi:hypothetical protein